MKNEAKCIHVLVNKDLEERAKNTVRYFLNFIAIEKGIPAKVTREVSSNKVIINNIWRDFKYLIKRVIGFPIFFIKIIFYKVDAYLDSIFYYDLSVGGTEDKVISKYGIRVDDPTKIVDISKDEGSYAEIGLCVTVQKDRPIKEVDA